MPISQRCTKSHVGRVPRNSAIEPAAKATNAFTLTPMNIWIAPGVIDCADAAGDRIDELRQQRPGKASQLLSEQYQAWPVVSANQIAIATSASASKRRTVRRLSGVAIFDCSEPASRTMPLWIRVATAT